MNFVYKLIVFTFLINVCAGILTSTVMTNWEVDFQDKIISYEVINGTTSEFGKEHVDEPGFIDGVVSIFDDFFGMITFGWYRIVIDFIKTYTYGSIGMIMSIIPFEPDAYEMVHNYLKAAISMMYGFALIMFITGKKLN